jgi:hypothetical protein
MAVPVPEIMDIPSYLCILKVSYDIVNSSKMVFYDKKVGVLTICYRLKEINWII